MIYKILNGDKELIYKASGFCFSRQNSSQAVVNDFFEMINSSFEISKTYSNISSMDIFFDSLLGPEDEQKLVELMPDNTSYFIYYQSSLCDKKIPLNGQKSIIIEFAKDFNAEKFFNKQSSAIRREKIGPAIWLLSYETEGKALKDYNKLYVLQKHLEFIYNLEPNFSQLEEYNFQQPISRVQPQDFLERPLNFEVFEQINYDPYSKNHSEVDVLIGVIDSRVDHRHLCFSKELDFIDCLDVELTVKLDYLGSHGTSCASIISGFQPDVIHSKDFIGIDSDATTISFQAVYQTSNNLQQTSLSSIIRSFYQAAYKIQVDLISCSLQLSSFPFNSKILENFLIEITEGKNLHQSIPIVFAAGNNINKTQFPADLPQIISVGSVDKVDDFIDDFENDGWISAKGKIDICAPTYIIAAKTLNGKVKVVENENRDDFHIFWGTSSSTPIVAAAAGLLMKKNKKITAKEVIQLLNDSARKPEEWDIDNCGPGILDITKLLNINQN